MEDENGMDAAARLAAGSAAPAEPGCLLWDALGLHRPDAGRGAGAGPRRGGGASPRAAPKKLEKPRGGVVMIVDDDPGIRRMVRMVLPKEFEVVGLDGGEEFLSMAEAYHPDLIIMDVNMPGEDGFQLCRRLRGLPSLRRIPVLFLTVMNEDEGFPRLLEVLGDAYLQKPFAARELIETIRRLIPAD